MRLLVTGGAGFIGANFVLRAVQDRADVSVTVLDALTYAGSRESLTAVEDRIKMVEGDLTDEPLVDRLVAESDAVVHFAAETHVDNALADPAPFLRSNVIGTFSVLRQVDLCRTQRRQFLYLGFYVAESAHMQYKAKFHPHERRLNGVWETIS